MEITKNRIGRAKMRSPGRPPVVHRAERRPFWAAIASGRSSEEAAQDAAYRRRSERDGFGSVEECPHRIFRRHRHRRQDGTCL